MMDHQETAADGIYHMILYNLLCFASVPVFVFGRQARKVAGINYQNPITESCHVLAGQTYYGTGRHKEPKKAKHNVCYSYSQRQKLP